MEQRKKIWKGKRIGKLVAGLLAVLVVINTCFSGVFWYVKAADSKETAVSVPNAVTPDDYKFYKAADAAAEAAANSDGWYNYSVLLKIVSGNSNGFNKIIEETDAGTVTSDSVEITESNGTATAKQRKFKLVKMNGDSIEVASDWFVPDLKIDTDKPTINVSCSLADDAWSNESQTITVTASDENSGIKEVKYSLNSDGSDAKNAAQTQEGTYTFETDEADGESPVYNIWAVDNAGNECEPEQIQVKLEYQSPEITYVSNDSVDVILNEGHKIIVDVEDKGDSGISNLTYGIPNKDPQEVPVSSAALQDDGKTYRFEIDTLKDENGNYVTDTNEYTFVAYDKAGNASDESKTTVHVDKAAPEVTGITMTTANHWENHRLNTIFGHFANEDVMVTITAQKDASLSKVKTITLSYKNTKNEEETVTATLSKAESVENGIAQYKAVFKLEIPANSIREVFNDVSVVATDEIGHNSVAKKYSNLNKIDNPLADSVLIEKIAPTVTFDTASITGEGVYAAADSKLWINRYGIVNFSIKDEDSGVYKYIRKINNTLVGTEIITGEESKTASVSNTLAMDAASENGKVIPPVDDYKYTLSVEAVDNAGNSGSGSCDIYVDTKAPVIKSVNSTEDDWSASNNITIKVDADDGSGSGVAKVVYYAADNGTNPNLTPAQMAADASTRVAALKDGKYEFTAEGEQDKVYYIMAVDNVGNISEVSTKTVRIDTTTPAVDNFFIEGNSDVTDAEVYSYKYGNFSNNNVRLYIITNDGAISSGIKSVKVYDGDTVISETVKAYTPNKDYICDINADKEYSNLKVEVTDNVGHVITKEISEIRADDSVSSNVLKLEKDASSIDISFAEEATRINNNDWYAKNTGITIDISDEVAEINSGIADVTVTLQAADVEPKVMKYNYTQGTVELMNRTYTLSTEDIAVPADGKYEVLVEVTDNAGNVSTKSKIIYVDATSPEVRNVELYSGETEFSSLNKLEFGNFYNTDAIVKVYFVDENASAGIDKKNVILHAGDKSYSPTGDITAEDGLYAAEYKLELDTNDVLRTEITDNVGHTTGVEPISSNNSTIKSDNIMLENNKSDIDVSVPKAAYIDRTNGASKEWYNAAVTFTVNVSDSESGIRSVDADINTSSKIKESYNSLSTKTTEKEYTVSTANSKELSAGSGAYQLSVNAVDNANNKASYSHTVYIDRTKPSIEKYEFSVKDYQEGSPTPVITTDYGYFFNQDVTLKVTAQDAAPTSGVAKINYRLDEAGKGNGEVKQAAVSNNQISIKVPSGFKGQIYTQPIDNVGNTGEWQTVQGTIHEEYDLHNNSSDVKITPLITTDKKDGAGYDLYSGNVPVRLHVEDKMSGIRKIEWKLESAGDPDNNQGGVIEVANGANSAQLSGDLGWNVISRENNLCTVLEKEIVAASNSNEIVITVKMTDRAGNISQSVNVFSIDKSAPQISVSYDNNNDDDGHEGFFKEARIATVTVNERNFNAEDVKVEITNTDGVMPSMTEWVKVSDGNGNLDNTVYSMNVIYAQDGDYTFNVHMTDKAGNQDAGADYGSSAAPTQFTVDTTVPVISLTYDNNNVYDNYYYQNARTATISINEHNFDDSRAIVTVTSKDNKGADLGNAPSDVSWSSANDVNTAHVVFDRDSNYTIAVTFTDMAGNIAQQIDEQRFCIDQVDPEITISGVKICNGNDKDGNYVNIAPVVEFKDTNLSIDNTKITLVGASTGSVDVKGVSTDTDETRVFTFDNIEKDDIYTVSAEAIDKSGRGRDKPVSYTFSVNRDGSTYQLSNETLKMNNSYTNNPVDVVVTEINVDSLVQDKISVTLAKDNNSKTLAADNDYLLEKSGVDGQWSKYTYTIRKDNFNEDGNYMVHLYSVDKAENVSQNDTNDENKKVEINFNVDKTKPDLGVVNIEEGKTYSEDKVDAIISAVDNSYVKELTVLINDKVEKQYNAAEIKEETKNNENIKVPVSNSNSKQKIEVRAIDAAGNENSVQVSNFLVTRNLWVRFINNKPLVAGTVATTSVVVVGGGASIVFLRRRKINIVK